MPWGDVRLVCCGIYEEMLIYGTFTAELCYARPDEFIPERWYKYPDLIKDRSAFAPFSLGMYPPVIFDIAY
jgi:cytochrome P450